MQKEKAKLIFDKYLSNIEVCNEKGINRDGEILAELIFLKYAGEDMVDVIKMVYKNIHMRNHYLPQKISID